MDGTIVDTEPLWIAAEKELVASYGGEWTDEMAYQLVGNPLPVSGQLIRDNSPVTLSSAEIVDFLLERVIAGMRAHVPWRPGAEELLKSLVAEGVPNALVTMSYESFAGVLIDAVAHGTFTVVVTGDRVSKGKPDPESYLTAARELGARPDECVAIEDSIPGVRAAVAAGVPTIAIPHVTEVPDIAGATRVDTLVGIEPYALLSLVRTRS
ncbi:phosphoglycolate phosphatase [Flexivirga endophytica]|uniref:Phosphoglycolate phosphatase n=1 Tax=Flexivirga endophytica TaxID=1849103 RepID=A0A916TB10_9MICO|nr:phosphoglycolate phosphatase [Flexivirga endophytica]GHB43423.1 phosphoglycolate phosphatase [Flexivirga endophytica]